MTDTTGTVAPEDGGVTVLSMKWGRKYSPDYVNILYRMVGRHLSVPFRFVCFTEDPSGLLPEIITRPLPEIHVPRAHDYSPWRKVSLFRKDLLEWGGRGLFMDLDVVVTGPLDDLLSHSTHVSIAENWTQRGRGIGNSSVFTFPIGTMSYVYDRYTAEIDSLFDHHDNEQIFVSRTTGERGELSFFPDEWIRSFKVDCMPGGVMNWVSTPRLPAGTKVVAFHGDPKPPDAARGRYPGKWYKHVRPTPWVMEHWR